MLMDLGEGDFTMGLPNSTDLSHLWLLDGQQTMLKHTVAHCVRKEGMTARAGSLEGYCVALLRMYLE